MSPSENQTISELRNEITAMREMLGEMVGDIRVLSAKLYGDDTAELPTGRIPLLEAEVKRIKKRQDQHARVLWTATGFIACINAIGWLASLVSHISGVFKK